MIVQAVQRVFRTREAAPWSFEGALHDHCREILRRIGWPRGEAERPLRTLGLTSCRGGEGVSTLAAHLAIAAAMRQERRVVLVDANLSQPAVARRFGAVPVPGLVECVCGGESAREALQPTSVQNLFVLPAGQMRVSPARVYDSTDLAAVADELAGHCEFVVFDLPPLGRASCANRLPAALDGVLLVVEAEGVHWEVAQRAKELLQYAGARIVGCVLNKWRDAA